TDSKAGLKQFDSLVFRHAGYCISNFVRTLSLSLSGGLITRAPVEDETADYYRQLTRMSSSLALVSDISMMLLGGGLKRKERLSARLGDVLSNLYLGCAVLKYYRDNGSNDEDLPYVHWNMQLALYNCQVALKEFFENLPNRRVAWLLKLVVFPFGNAYRLPDDALEHELVQTMFSDNELRDRITSHMFIGGDDSDPAYVIEDAFRKILATKKTRKAIRLAVKLNRIPDTHDIQVQANAAVKASLCTQAEADVYLDAERARNKAIQVDDFPASYFQENS
ncbi:MAG: DUF1974 domain-containing protein, partial [Gammaproteobacteria bacterium]|nr:DUF1974 domain-containing protein [Gammaproteobacteria bacterium]